MTARNSPLSSSLHLSSARKFLRASLTSSDLLAYPLSATTLSTSPPIPPRRDIFIVPALQLGLVDPIQGFFIIFEFSIVRCQLNYRSKSRSAWCIQAACFSGALRTFALSARHPP